jgi:ribosomal-protein-serine acetyltransferase
MAFSSSTPGITTSEFSLKILSKEDAPRLFQAIDRNREILSHWISWVENTHHIDDSLLFIEDSQKKLRQGEGMVLGIWVGESLAGCIGLHEISKVHKMAQIGYWLGEAYQGKGLVTRACRLLIPYAFDTLVLQRIEILCASKNYKSRAVPQRLNFMQEGVLRQYHMLHGQAIDMVIYSLLRHDWKR